MIFLNISSYTKLKEMIQYKLESILLVALLKKKPAPECQECYSNNIFLIDTIRLVLITSKYRNWFEIEFGISNLNHYYTNIDIAGAILITT